MHANSSQGVKDNTRLCILDNVLEITVKNLYHHVNKQINKAGITYLAIVQKYFHMIEDICHCIQHKHIIFISM